MKKTMRNCLKDSRKKKTWNNFGKKLFEKETNRKNNKRRNHWTNHRKKSWKTPEGTLGGILVKFLDVVPFKVPRSICGNFQWEPLEEFWNKSKKKRRIFLKKFSRVFSGRVLEGIFGRIPNTNLWKNFSEGNPARLLGEITGDIPE